MNIYITTQNFEIIHNASEPIKKKLNVSLIWIFVIQLHAITLLVII